jgi:hypothetical protein
MAPLSVIALSCGEARVAADMRDDHELQADGECRTELGHLRAHRGCSARPPGALSGHNEIMRRSHAVWQVSQSAAALLLTVAFAPLIMVAGEPLRRYVLARPAARPSRPGWYRTLRRSRPGTQTATFSHGPAGTVHVFWHRPRFWLLVVSNPLWIALTAPARWLLDRASVFGRRGWPGPPAAGVREPRRPKPALPSGSVALAEPRAEPVLARLLGTAVRRPGRRDDHEELRQQGRGGRRRRGGGRRRSQGTV